MRTSGRHGRLNALQLFAAALSIAGSVSGCGRGDGAVPVPGTMHAAASFQTRTFKGRYGGDYVLESCDQRGNKRQPGAFTFYGSGTAKLLGASLEHGQMTEKLLNGRTCVREWDGSATITAQDDPDSSISVTLSQPSHPSPCQRAVTFTVTGGTGKFSGATGNGTVAFKCRDDGSYEDRWSGSIEY